MEKIEALIHPFASDQVCEELVALHVKQIIATEVREVDEKRNGSRVYSHTDWNEHGSWDRSQVWYDTIQMAKIKLELIVPESMANRVVATIIRAGKTSNGVDIKVFISVVERVIG